MIKLSITLPAGGQVCIESEDRELVREVLHSFMPQLTGMPPLTGANGAAAAVGISGEPPAYANGHGNDRGAVLNGPGEPTATAPIEPVAPAPAAATPTAVEQVALPSVAEAIDASNGARAAEPLDTAASARAAESATAAEREFMAFCQQVSPLGDMRRVVVAAEAAHRYLNVNSVDPDELSNLFALAGWPIPHSFVQTLRNAARTKFRWLERIPGMPGHYKVTNTGRSIVLGHGDVTPESD